MKRNLLTRHLFACLLFSIYFISSSMGANAQCKLLNENFNTAPTLAASQAPGAWYPDRYPPAGFTSASFGGGNVLKISIDGNADGAANRPAAQSSSFYNTQGRKFDQCGGCVTVFKGDLYIPSDWATKHRRSDLWATAYDATNAISAYPIIGFRNIDGASPNIDYYDVISDVWIHSGVTITYNTWYTLQFRLSGNNLQYLVNNVVVGTISSGSPASAYFADVMVQAYNFNDAAIPVASGTQSTDSYDVYWDNLVTTGTGGKVVTNTNTGETFCSIQGAIDDADTQDGQTIVVGPGTYNENVTVTKSLNLKGNNYNVTCAGSRNAESVINGILASGTPAISVDENNVSVNGFKIINPGGSFGIYAKGRSNTTIKYNIITDIGNSVNGSIATYGVAIEMGSSANISDVVVSNNCINNIRGGENTSLTGSAAKSNNGSAGGIVAGFTTASFSVSNLTIASNIIDHITASTNAFADGGKGAYGVLINVGANGSFAGKAISPTVQNNRVTFLEGLWAHGIGLEGETPGATVLNNLVSNLTDHKGNTDAVGVRVEDNDGAGSVAINNNSLTNMALAISNLTATTVNGTCNWYGTTNTATIAGKIEGPVTYIPFLSTGTNSGSPGFQPQPNSCTGCPGGSVTNINTGLSYCSIQAAIDDPATVNGHTLKASAGTFTENVNVTKQLTIKGNNTGKPGIGARLAESVVDANSISAAFNLSNSNITIDGFSIIHGANGLNAGVWMDASKGNNKVINNIIKNNGIGVYANCATASLIKDNWFNANNDLSASSGGSGIYSEYTTNLTVEYNEFSGHTENNPVIFAATGAGVHKNLNFSKNNLHDNPYGVYCISVSNSTFSSNIFNVPNSTCLAFAGASTSNSISNNFFKGTYRGVRVEDDGYGYGANSNITIHENSFSSTFAAHILLSGAYTPASLNATCNWYGTTNQATITSKISGAVTFKPYLTDGTDILTNRGFQPKANVCNGPAPVCNLSGGTISMSPSTPVPGQNLNTIYRGYGPTCATLTPATVSGGTSPYTYKWNTGSTNKSISVCPTSTTTYTVTIKDQKGCSLVKSFTVKVIDARCGTNKDKVLFCINGKPDCDSKADADAHVKKGDKLGPCTNTAARSGDVAVEDDIFISGEQSVSVYPNPSYGSFTVKLQNYGNIETAIEVVDVSGRLLEKRNLQDGLQTRTVNFELKTKIPGMYFIKVITKDGVKTEKVMVVNK